MPQAVELPDDLADVFDSRSVRLGLSLRDYAVRLLSSTRESAISVGSGADLVSFWRNEGLIGSRRTSAIAKWKPAASAMKPSTAGRDLHVCSRH